MKYFSVTQLVIIHIYVTGMTPKLLSRDNNYTLLYNKKTDLV
jgi:hypothetical protein